MPLASAWSLWWISNRAAVGFRDFWNAPIFVPTPGAFAFSEPLVLEGLVATPLLWAGASPVLAHNLVLLTALVTNGAFALGLLSALGLAPLASLAGGGMLTLLPYVHHELGVLTLVPLAGVLATLHGLLAFARNPTPGRGASLGLAFAAAYLLCGQHALFLALVAAPACVCLLRRTLLTRRSLLGALVAAVAAGTLVLPVVNAQLAARRAYGFARGERSAELGSAAPGSFWLTPATPWVPLPGIRTVARPSEQAHFPGALKLMLASAGLAFAVRQREHRRVSAFLVVLAAGAVVLATLPRLELLGFTPFPRLRDTLPGLAQVRSFWRATMLMQVATALLAALGLDALATAARRPARAAARAAAAAGVIALAIVACLELWPPAPALSPAPSREAWQPWLAWIEANVPPGAALVHLPVPASEGVVDYEETARAMLLATAHGHPLVNGYSSYFPRPYRAFARIMRGCPAPAAWQLLVEIGLHTLSVRSSWLAQDPRCGPPAALYRRAAVFPELDAELWQAIPASAPGPAGTPGAP